MIDQLIKGIKSGFEKITEHRAALVTTDKDFHHLNGVFLNVINA